MRSSFLFTIISLVLLSSCSNQKQEPNNDPYAELGDTVPASEFAPTTKDSLNPDTALSESVAEIQTVQTPSKSAPKKPQVAPSNPANSAPKKTQVASSNPAKSAPKKTQVAPSNPANSAPKKTQVAPSNPAKSAPKKPQVVPSNPANSAKK